MHFQANVTVRLREPVPTVGPEGSPDGGSATGYVVSMCVHARDAEEATAMAAELALCPRDGHGTRTRYDGTVEEAEVFEIRRERLDPNILAQARNIDQPGVYMSTALAFFDHEAVEPPAQGRRKWWQFWK